MSATIIDMDYRVVDILTSDQLEVDDLIGFEGEVLKIVSITSMRHGFLLTVENEFGEKDLLEVLDDEKFDLYILD
jgi:hypothetical protein